MKILIVVLLSFAVTSCALFGGGCESSIRASLVEITTVDSEGEKSRFSGFVVKNEGGICHIYTTGHGFFEVANTRRIDVASQQEILEIFRKNDLGQDVVKLLAICPRDFPVLKTEIYHTGLVGTRVISGGFSSESDQAQLKKGRVTNEVYAVTPEYDPTFFITTKIKKGDSGSPVCYCDGGIPVAIGMVRGFKLSHYEVKKVWDGQLDEMIYEEVPVTLGGVAIILPLRQ